MTQKKTPRLRTAIAALTAAGLIAAQMPHAAAESIHDNPLYTGMGILVDRGQEPSAAVHAAPLALVKTAGKWGVLRADGKQVVPAAYRHIEELTEDRIVVQDADKKWGCYGTDGTLILPVVHRDIVPYHDGAALVQGTDKRWSFYRADGSRLTEKSYTSAGIFSEGLASVMEDKKHVGFINMDGTEVIAPQYALAMIFSEGLAAVAVKGKWGFIDKSGTMIIAPQFRDVAGGFSEGLAGVQSKKNWIFIDKTGTKQFDARYETVLPFNNGTAEVHRKAKTTNFLGAAIGVAAFASGFLSLGTDLYTDPKIKRGYIDHSGNEIVSPKNNYNSTYVDGMALVVVKGKWGCVNEKGAYIVEPKYNEMHRFSEDMAAVKDGDKWGFVGRDGQIAIAPAYEEAHDFHEDLAVVKGGKAFFIDKTGRVPFLVPSTITVLGDFASGLAPAKIGDKWGFIDHAGTIVIDPAYDAAGTF